MILLKEPSICVLVLPFECSPCGGHLLFFWYREKFLRHPEDLIVRKSQGRINEIGKSSGLENIAQARSKKFERFAGGTRRGKWSKINDRKRSKGGSHLELQSSFQRQSPEKSETAI